MTDLLLGWLTDLGNYSYLIVFALVFAESGLLLLLPGETVLLLAGVLVSKHILLLWPLMIVAASAAIAGDACGYFLGRGPARRRFHTTGRFLLFRANAIDRVHKFLARFGPLAIVASRFISLLRVGTPFVCGLSDVPPQRFFPFNIAAGLIWGSGIVLVGDFGGHAFERAHHWIGRGSLALGILILIGSRSSCGICAGSGTRARRVSLTLQTGHATIPGEASQTHDSKAAR